MNRMPPPLEPEAPAPRARTQRTTDRPAPTAPRRDGPIYRAPAEEDLAQDGAVRRSQAFDTPDPAVRRSQTLDASDPAVRRSQAFDAPDPVVRRQAPFDAPDQAGSLHDVAADGTPAARPRIVETPTVVPPSAAPVPVTPADTIVHTEPPVDRTKPGNRGTYAAIIAATAIAVVIALALFGSGGDDVPPPETPATTTTQ